MARALAAFVFLGTGIFAVLFALIFLLSLPQSKSWLRSILMPAKLRAVSRKRALLLHILFWAVLFGIDLVVLAAYYPGIFSYDIIIQTDQALGYLAVDRFHPPLHTFLWRGCLAVSGWLQTDLRLRIQGAITIYGIFQAAILSWVLGGVVVEFFCSGWRLGASIALLLCFACNPVIWIFSIIPAKDVLFSCFFMAFTMRLYAALRETPQYIRRNYFALGLDMLLCSLLRNNAVYAFGMMTAFVLLRRRVYGKRIVCTFLAALLFYLLVNGPLYTAFGVEGGDIREAMSLPLQQIAHVYVSEKEDLPEETIQAIGKYLRTDDLNAMFNPRFADPVKRRAGEDVIREDFFGFFRLYFMLFRAYPDNYLNEFLALNVPSWYPLALGTDPYSKRDYIEDFLEEYDRAQPVRDSRIPALLERLERIADYSAFEAIPVLRHIFSMAAPIWLALLCTVLLLCTGRGKAALVCAAPILLWMTYLAGPVTAMRYMFPLSLQAPLLLLFVLNEILTAAEHSEPTYL